MLTLTHDSNNNNNNNNINNNNNNNKNSNNNNNSCIFISAYALLYCRNKFLDNARSLVQKGRIRREEAADSTPAATIQVPYLYLSFVRRANALNPINVKDSAWPRAVSLSRQPPLSIESRGSL